MNTATVAIELTASEVADLAIDTLYALERRAGWEPAYHREQAQQLEDGEHALYAALTAVYGVLESTVAAMRATADVIEANGRLATSQLERLRASATPQPWSYRS